MQRKCDTTTTVTTNNMEKSLAVATILFFLCVVNVDGSNPTTTEPTPTTSQTTSTTQLPSNPISLRPLKTAEPLSNTTDPTPTLDTPPKSAPVTNTPPKNPTQPAQSKQSTPFTQPAQSTLSTHSPSDLGWIDFLTQGMNLLPSGMTLDELMSTMEMIPSLDQNVLSGLLQSLGIAVPNPSQLDNVLTVFDDLGSILEWGSIQVPNGDFEDLVNLLSTMDENSLQSLFQSLDVDILTSTQFNDALSLLQDLQNSVPDGSINPSNLDGGLNDILNMISTMNAQSLKLYLQSLNIDIPDPSQLGGVLTALQTLQSLSTSGNLQLPNGNIDDLLNMMSTMNSQSLAALLQTLNIDTLDPSQLGDSLNILQSLQSALANGNVQLPNGNVNDLFNLMSTMDAASLQLLLQSFNSDPSKLGDVMIILQSLQNSISGSSFLVANGTNFNPGDYLDLSAVSSDCNNAVSVLISQIQEQKPWALKMLDSWGRPQTGILDGNKQWLGSYDQCLSVQPETEIAFKPNYCIAGNESEFLLGMCLPKSCTKKDIYNITNSMFALLPFNVVPTVDFARCKEEIEYDTRAIVATCVCGCFIIVIILATLFDVILMRPKLQANPPIVVKESIADNETNGDISAAENGNSTHHVELKFDTKTGQMQTNGGHEGHKYKLNSDAIQAKETPTSPYSGILPKIVLSFSVWTNGKKLLSTEKTDYTIGSINGICFFSMTWVILAHSFSSALDTKIFADQTSGTTTLLQRHSFMAISNGYVSIDSFFAMSGLLISYVFMKAMKTAKGRINWFMFFFHRFWRLTPPYMMVMMVDIALFRYLSDGPTWSPDGLETDFCKDTWWTNLLYINNFVKTEKNCLSWSWYMTNDMQFFVLSPLLLVPLYFSKKIGGLIAAIFLIGVTGASGYITYQNQLPSTQYSTGLSSTDDYYQMYYVKPYCRMGPYVVGVIIGYILYKTGRNYKINWVVNIIIWIMMSALACVILYGIYPEMSGSTTSVEVSTLYNALHRTVWGAIVCWVVFACVTGNGGFVNTFLSWSPFIVLRRLTYCAYLVHPLVTAVYYRSHRQKLFMTNLNIIYLFLGHLVITYMVAFVVFLAFQSPLLRLEKAVFTKDKEETKQLLKKIVF